MPRAPRVGRIGVGADVVDLSGAFTVVRRGAADVFDNGTAPVDSVAEGHLPPAQLRVALPGAVRTGSVVLMLRTAAPREPTVFCTRDTDGVTRLRSVTVLTLSSRGGRVDEDALPEMSSTLTRETAALVSSRGGGGV